jgi:hypothetical protein
MADEPSAAQRSAALRSYGLDPTSSVEARVQETPAAVLKMFADEGLSTTSHPLTAVERRQLSSAIASLPPLSR